MSERFPHVSKRNRGLAVSAASRTGGRGQPALVGDGGAASALLSETTARQGSID